MRLLKVKSPILLGLGIMLVLLSACGVNGSTNSTGSSQTPAQLLLKTTEVMKQLKSVAFNLKMSTAVTTPTLTRTATMTMQGTGVLIQPDQSQMQLSIITGSGMPKLTLSKIMTGQKLYLQNQTGQWYVLDKSVLNSTAGTAGNPFLGTDVNSYATLLTLVNDTTLKDDGTAPLYGVALRHITLTFGKNASRDLLNATGALGRVPASQQQDVLQSVTMKKMVLDVWIDEATSYLHSMSLQIDINIDEDNFTASTTPTSSMINNREDITIDYSKFNQPATITIPTNATPAQDVASAFL